MEAYVLEITSGAVVFLFSFAVKFLASIAHDIGEIKVSVSGAVSSIEHHEDRLEDHERRLRTIELSDATRR